VESLQSYLTQALPQSSAISLNRISDFSVVTVISGRNLFVFAVADDDQRACYFSTYPQLQKWIREDKNYSAAANIDYVLCISEYQQDLQGFYSELENDQYFCRKFVVVAHSDDPATLRQNLARLPFLPLNDSSGTAERLPPAQSYLQMLGVSPELSRVLAQQRERVAERLVDTLLLNEFGAPPLIRIGQSSLNSSASEGQPEDRVRLKSLTIENFRAYKKKQVFDLDADVIVLFGPNGFGKTSFFDALDFAATGEIGRLPNGRGAKLQKVARHLDAAQNEGSVEITFSNGTKDSVLYRSVSDATSARIDGTTVARKAALSTITNAQLSEKDRIENLTRLFRATHLFSQESQELAAEFRSSSRLPADVVSRLLAFEDYLHAVSKVEATEKVLKERAALDDENILAKRSEIAAAQKEIARLKSVQSIGDSAPDIERARASISTDLKAIGISAVFDEISIPALRELRGVIGNAVLEAKSRVDRLNDILEKLPQHYSSIENIKRLEAQVLDVNGRLTSLQQLATRLDKEVIDLRATVGSFTKARDDAANRRNALEWAVLAIPRLRELRERRPVLQESISRLDRLVAEGRQTQDTLTSKHLLAVGASNAKRSALDASKAELETIRDLAVAYDSVGRSRVQLAVALSTQSDLASQRAVAQEQLQSLQVSIEAERKTEIQLQHAYEVANAAHSKLAELLSELLNHVDGPKCPACGIDHDSLDAVRVRIQSSIDNAQSDTSTMEAIIAAREKRIGFQQSASLAEKTIAAIAAQLPAVLSQIESARRDIGAFESKLVKVGFAPDSQNLHQLIERKITEISARVNAESSAAAQLSDVVADAKTHMENAKQGQNALEVERANLAKQAAEGNDAEKNIIAEFGRREISSDLPEQELQAMFQEAEKVARERAELLVENTTAYSARVRDRTDAGDQIAQKSREASIAAKELSECRQQKAAFEESFSLAGLSSETDASNLVEIISMNAGELEKMSNLLTRVTDLELALDSATTAAASQGIHERISALEKDIERRSSNRTALKKWQSSFLNIRDALQKKYEEAVSAYAKYFGPRASLIQQRLRPVLGFDDILLTSESGGVNVSVQRKGEKLSPVDYFSQAQERILLLSIFLSTSSVQTWSQFSPILMDDPITHFDDLNCFSFLDLLSGFVEGGFGSRQFILSTCEDRMFDLAKSRLSHMGSRVRFYSFVSLAGDGPMIERR